MSRASASFAFGPVPERAAIFDSYACRTGRGAQAAVQRAATYARHHGWFLKMDIRKYFDSIDQGVLRGLLRRKFKAAGVLEMFDRILASYQTAPGRGLPIGNLTSQHFANLYLAPLDRLIKRRALRESSGLSLSNNAVNDRSTLKAAHLPTIARTRASRARCTKKPASHLVRGSGKVAVNLIAVEAAHKGDRPILEDKAEAMIPQANAEILPLASSRLRWGISRNVRAASTCSITRLIRRNSPASVRADKSSAKDSRKRVFTPRGRAVGKPCGGW